MRDDERSTDLGVPIPRATDSFFIAQIKSFAVRRINERNKKTLDTQIVLGRAVRDYLVVKKEIVVAQHDFDTIDEQLAREDQAVQSWYDTLDAMRILQRAQAELATLRLQAQIDQIKGVQSTPRGPGVAERAHLEIERLKSDFGKLVDGLKSAAEDSPEAQEELRNLIAMAEAKRSEKIAAVMEAL